MWGVGKVLTAEHLCAKFEVSSHIRPRDIRGPKITTLSPDLQVTPFSLVLTAVHLRAKLEVSIFNRSGDIMGSHNCVSGSLNPH